jgi:hypothetical protein
MSRISTAAAAFAVALATSPATLALAETGEVASGREPSQTVTWLVTIFSAIGLVFLAKSTYGRKQ